MESLGLGEIITAPQGRDAIHIAVVPVVAAQVIHRGDWVRLSEDGRAFRCKNDLAHKRVGVADPFLGLKDSDAKDYAERGETFWLYLIPGSITSLAHHWTHPSFDDTTPKPTARSASEQWIRDYADIVGLSYNELMQGAQEWIDYDEPLSRGGLLEGVHLPDEFWNHYEEVKGGATNLVPREKRQSFFSCAC